MKFGLSGLYLWGYHLILYFKNDFLQRTWEEAIKACKKIGMKLLFFNKTNNLEMDAIMSAIKNYRVALGKKY